MTRTSEKRREFRGATEPETALSEAENIPEAPECVPMALPASAAAMFDGPVLFFSFFPMKPPTKNSFHPSSEQLEKRDMPSGNPLSPSLQSYQDAYQAVVSGKIANAQDIPGNLDADGSLHTLLALKNQDSTAQASLSREQATLTGMQATEKADEAALNATQAQENSLQGSLLSAQAANPDLGAWGVNAQTGLHSISGINGTPFVRMAVSPDGAGLLTVNANGRVVIYDMHSARALKTIDTGLQGISAIAWAPGGDAFSLTGKIDRQNDWHLEVWNTNGTLRWMKSYGRIGAMSTGWSNDGNTVSVGISPGQSVLYDTATGREKLRTPSFSNMHTSALSPDGKVFYVENIPGVTAYDTKTGAALCSYQNITGAVSAITPSPDGKYLLIGGFQGQVLLYDLANNSSTEVMKLGGGVVSSMDWNSAATQFSVAKNGTGDAAVTVFSWKDGKALKVQTRTFPGIELSGFTAKFDRNGSLDINTSSEKVSAIGYLPIGNQAPDPALQLANLRAQEKTQAAAIAADKANLAAEQAAADAALAAFQSADALYSTMSGIVAQSIAQRIQQESASAAVAAAQALASPEAVLPTPTIVTKNYFGNPSCYCIDVNYANMPAGTTISSWSDTGMFLVDSLPMNGSGKFTVGFPLTCNCQTAILHFFRQGVEVGQMTVHPRTKQDDGVTTNAPWLLPGAPAQVRTSDPTAATPDYSHIPDITGRDLVHIAGDQIMEIAGVSIKETARQIGARLYPNLLGPNVTPPSNVQDYLDGISTAMDHAYDIINQAAYAAFLEECNKRAGHPNPYTNHIQEILNSDRWPSLGLLPDVATLRRAMSDDAIFAKLYKIAMGIDADSLANQQRVTFLSTEGINPATAGMSDALIAANQKYAQNVATNTRVALVDPTTTTQTVAANNTEKIVVNGDTLSAMNTQTLLQLIADATKNRDSALARGDQKTAAAESQLLDAAQKLLLNPTRPDAPALMDIINRMSTDPVNFTLKDVVSFSNSDHPLQINEQSGVYRATFNILQSSMVNIYLSENYNGDIQIQNQDGSVQFSSAHSGLSADSISTMLPSGKYLITISRTSATFTSTAPLTCGLTIDINPFQKSRITGVISEEGINHINHVIMIGFGGIENNKIIATDILPDKPTWVVIHGRTDSSQDDAMKELAQNLKNHGEQVITIDWSEAAKDFPADLVPNLVDLADARWTNVVGQWLAHQFEMLNIKPSLINFVAHSHGTYVSYFAAKTLQEEKFGTVNSVTALDSAKNCWLLNGPIVDIDFSKVSQYSWSFKSSVLGSSAKSATATYMFDIVESGTIDPTKNHSYAVTLFSQMIADSNSNTVDSVAQEFSLNKLLKHEPMTKIENMKLGTKPITIDAAASHSYHYDGTDWWKASAGYMFFYNEQGVRQILMRSGRIYEYPDSMDGDPNGMNVLQGIFIDDAQH